MNDADTTAVMAALADPTRRALFESLVRVPQVVGDLAVGVPVSRSAVSQHLKVLKEAGLVVEQKLGRQVRYEAAARTLSETMCYLQSMVEALEGSRVAEGDGAAKVLPTRKPAVPSDDEIDAAMAHWAETSLKHDPVTVAMIARLRLVSGLLEGRYAKVAGRFGLSTGEAMILSTLRRLGDRPGVTPGELARASVVAPPSLAKHLGVLQQGGLIRRELNPADRRSHRLRLTRKGRDVADAIVDEQLGRHYAALFDLPETERRTLDRALRVLMSDLRSHEVRRGER